MKKERQAYILHQLNLHNKVLVSNLCLDMSVSQDTVRRDLQELANVRKLTQVHGGAISLAFSEMPSRSESIYSYKQKKVIAEKAIRLIKDDMCVLTSGGTTIVEMGRHLPSHLRATFITGSIPALNVYLSHPNIDVIAVGDRVNKQSKISVGATTIEKIKQVNADLCLLGTNAIDAKKGITDNDIDVVQLKRAMIDASARTACLTIAEKLNSFQALQVCELNRIDYLITELDPTDPLLQPYADIGITVL